jgi:hypothetical protein
MGAMTDYFESGIMNQLFRSVTFTFPSHLYIGLVTNYTVNAMEAGSVTEPSVGGYARKVYDPSTANWIAPYPTGTAGAMAIHNMKEIAFDAATADQGTINGVIIASDVSATNNIILYGALTTPRDIRNGDAFTFPSGALKITFN